MPIDSPYGGPAYIALHSENTLRFNNLEEVKTIPLIAVQSPQMNVARQRNNFRLGSRHLILLQLYLHTMDTFSMFTMVEGSDLPTETKLKI